MQKGIFSAHNFLRQKNPDFDGELQGETRQEHPPGFGIGTGTMGWLRP